MQQSALLLVGGQQDPSGPQAPSHHSYVFAVASDCLSPSLLLRLWWDRPHSKQESTLDEPAYVKSDLSSLRAFRDSSKYNLTLLTVVTQGVWVEAVTRVQIPLQGKKRKEKNVKSTKSCKNQIFLGGKHRWVSSNKWWRLSTYVSTLNLFNLSGYSVSTLVYVGH